MTKVSTQSRRSFLANTTLAGAVTIGGGQLAALAGRSRSPEALAADEYLLGKGVVYLNTAALGPSPRAVVEKTMAAWYDLESDPSFLGYGRLRQAMEGVRARAAAFLGCATEEMVITNSTTDGLNMVAQGLTLTAGQHILITDQEHLGGRSGWAHVARRLGLVIDTVVLPAELHDTQAIVDRFAAAITPATRVISVSHVLTSTGLRMPIAEVAALARNRGCLCVVDGAQAVGAIPVNVKSLGCHAYATSGHKWLMGPKGTGLLYLNAEAKETFDPIAIEDGRNVYSESTGVRQIPGVLGLGVAIDAMSATGMATVESRAVALRNRLYTELSAFPRVTVVSPRPGPLATPIITFRIPDAIDAGALVVTMREKYKIDAKSGRIMMPKNAINGLRISPHIFNSQHDLDELMRALRAELA